MPCPHFLRVCYPRDRGNICNFVGAIASKCLHPWEIVPPVSHLKLFPNCPISADAELFPNLAVSQFPDG